MQKERLCVVMPVYNEEAAIGPVLAGTFTWFYGDGLTNRMGVEYNFADRKK